MARRHRQPGGRPKDWTEDRLWDLYSKIILIQIRTGKRIMAACRDYARTAKLDPKLVHRRFKQAARRPHSNELVIRFAYRPQTFRVVGSISQLDGLLRHLKLRRNVTNSPLMAIDDRLAHPRSAAEMAYLLTYIKPIGSKPKR